MQEAVHLGLEKEVVDTVHKDVASCARTGSEGCPLPEVVLGIEAEVDDNDGRHTNDNGQDPVHPEQEPVNMVELVVPKAREDVVELNEDGAKAE